MKKLILLFTVLITAFFTAPELRSQNNTTGEPEVELPSFVIVGYRTFVFPEMKKLGAKPLPALTDEVLRPDLTNDYPQALRFEDTYKAGPDLKDSSLILNGFVEGTAGNIYIPSGELRVSVPLGNAFLSGEFAGFNMRGYLPNADEVYGRGNLGIKIFSDDKGGVLPGAEYFVNLGYNINSFKFFASPKADSGRVLSNAKTEIGFRNLKAKEIQYGASVKGSMADIGSTKFNESLIEFSGFLNTKLDFIELFTDFYLVNQNLENGLITVQNIVYSKFSAMGGFNINNTMRLFGGVEYASVDSVFSLKPKISFSMKFINGLYLIASYNPVYKYYSQSDLLNANRYYSPGQSVYFIEKQEHVLNAAIRYEYMKYFSVVAGAEYSKSENLPYFDETPGGGFFSLSSASAEALTGYVSVAVNPGPLGKFAGEVKYNRVTLDDGKIFPYKPEFQITAEYGKTLLDHITFDVSVAYMTGRYADKSNNILTKDFLNISGGVDLAIDQQFSVIGRIHNLLNADNYMWNGYQLPGYMISGGVNLRF